MNRLLLSLFASTFLFAACGNNNADNDVETSGADTTMAAPADGSMEATSGMDGMDPNTSDGSMNTGEGDGRSSGNTVSNPNNRGGTDNSGVGISGGQGSNPNTGSNPAGVSTSVGTGTSGSGQRRGNNAPYPVDGISTADGAAPTSTRANRDNVTNDSLNNRAGMGVSR